MKTCPNCGESVQDTAKFCSNCAAPVSAEASIVAPAEETTPDSARDSATVSIVAPAEETLTVPVVETPAVPAEEAAAVSVEVSDIPAAQPFPEPVAAPAPEQKKNHLGKGLLIGGVGVLAVGAIVAAVGIGVSMLGGEKNNNVYYYKDGEISVSILGKKPEPHALTDRLFSADEIDSDAIGRLAYTMLLSKDGKTVFYPERYADSGLFTLYYRDADDTDAVPVKVDSDVSFYAIDEKAKNIYYIKGEGAEATLYHKSLKDDVKTKIAENVGDGFFSNDDLSRVVYTIEEEATETDALSVYQPTTYALYLIERGGEPQRIDRGVESLAYYNKALNVFYYLKEGSLYLKKGSEEKVKIDSDVYHVVKVYDSGEVYFVRENNEQVRLSDYFEDDMKDADAAITAPVYPEYPDFPDSPVYPYSFEFDTYEEYEAAFAQYQLDYAAWEKQCDDMRAEYDAVYDKYWEDYEVYYDKLDRDYIREQLETSELNVSPFELCYYNGTEVVIVNDSVKYSYYSSSDIVDNAMVFLAYEKGEVTKTKMSEMGDDFSIYALQEKVKEALYGTTTHCLATGGTYVVLDIEFGEYDYGDVMIDEKGTYVYYCLNTDENGHTADLYRASITKDGMRTAELYDTEVYVNAVTPVGDDVMYYKNVPLIEDEEDGWTHAGDSGDLYISKQLVECGVNIGYGFNSEDNSLWYYISDFDEEDECGTLKVYNGKESVVIAEDVHDYTFDNEYRMYYLVDYSNTYACGTLYYYNGKESIRIDDDVTGVIPVYQGGNVLHALMEE